MIFRQEQNAIRFVDGDTEAGQLVLNDPYKPYLHPVRTPAGHIVSDTMPCDHRHHKGLMYALGCEDLNFWEEGDSADIGVQKICDLRLAGDAVEMDILWLSIAGGMETYRETRTISCRREPGLQAFVWTWTSRRTALRPHRLVKSPWSSKLPDGRIINYHGLGIRLPRSWSFEQPPQAGALVEGVPVPAEEAMGTTSPEAAVWGRIDGHWDPPSASVTIRQSHGFAYFVLRGGFTYLSVGPSNLHELDIPAKAETTERYEVVVADRPLSSPLERLAQTQSESP